MDSWPGAKTPCELDKPGRHGTGVLEQTGQDSGAPKQGQVCTRAKIKAAIPCNCSMKQALVCTWPGSGWRRCTVPERAAEEGRGVMSETRTGSRLDLYKFINLLPSPFPTPET